MLLVWRSREKRKKYIPLKDIAERQNVSKKYLEQIVPVLNKSDMLQTNRGYQGGYRLAKPPEECPVGKILRLTEGDLAPVACLAHDSDRCQREEECITLPVWQGLYRVITEYLDGITLAGYSGGAGEKRRASSGRGRNIIYCL